jgi:signal transduction histidine kinase
MSATGLILAAAAGAGLSLLAGRAARRAAPRRDGGEAAQRALEAFDAAVIEIGPRGTPQDVRLAAGQAGLQACAAAMGCPAEPAAVLAALERDAALAAALAALTRDGRPFQQAIGLGAQSVAAEGRASGALCWVWLALRTAPATAEPAEPRADALHLAQALHALPLPAWIAGPNGDVVWTNAQGATLDIGAGPLARQVIADGRDVDVQRRMTATGARRILRLMARPLPGGSAAVFALDETEAEDAREALRRHLEAQSETLDHIGEAVAIFAADQRLLFHNSAFCVLWGLEPAWLAERPGHGEILDRLRQRRRLPDTVDYAAFKAAELARYGALDPGEAEIWPLPDGRSLRLLRQQHPLGGLLLLFSDITDELKLKAEFNALIQVQRATLDALSDAVAVFGSDGRLRLHNAAFAALWGAGQEQMAAAGDFDGVVELCLRRVHDLHLWRALKARVTDTDPIARAPLAGEARTSDRRILAYQSRPLPDGATLLAFADVTDTRALESALAELKGALEETGRLKQEFVANVSYELRTPMTTIIGYAEMLEQMGDALPPPILGPIAAMRSAAAQLGRSIGDVLDMAQIDADDLALNLADTPVYSLLGDVAGRWASAAQEAGAHILIDCPPAIGAIRADGGRLGQALDHLLETAVRQSPPGGLVTLAARRAFGEIQLQVKDQGRGIPYHVQAHIFDRFVSRDRGGPGLGLALVKAIVELHGGWIDLESAPGSGSAFTCHLPEAASEARPQT